MGRAGLPGVAVPVKMGSQRRRQDTPVHWQVTLDSHPTTRDKPKDDSDVYANL